ncbi:MAG: DUF3240 family protein [Alphaproteobacteria bacterium]|nr:DUF3240 family protein [Alphaproteobacteria bacterium]
MSHVKITLSAPAALGEQVAEFLLESEWLPGGFATAAVSRHGRDFEDATLREQVRGRVDALLITAILPAAHVPALLDQLRERFTTARLLYWTEPVLDFGDFG